MLEVFICCCANENEDIILKAVNLNGKKRENPKKEMP
jgi:hypothetical protein